MSLIDTHNSRQGHPGIGSSIGMSIREMRKSDEAEIVDKLRKTILPMETAGSSLVTTHRVLKGLYDFYSRPGNRYYTSPSVKKNILLGVGISTFAGLPLEEKVAEMRDFVCQEGISFATCESFLKQAISKAENMGYEKLYVKTQNDFGKLKILYRKLGFQPVEDQSQKEGGHVNRGLFFRSL